MVNLTVLHAILAYEIIAQFYKPSYSDSCFYVITGRPRPSRFANTINSSASTVNDQFNHENPTLSGRI